MAIASCYGPPHAELLQASAGTYYTVQQTDDNIQAFNVKTITSVVMMAPDLIYPNFFHDNSTSSRFFLMEKPGLKLLTMVGLDGEVEEEMEE